MYMKNESVNTSLQERKHIRFVDVKKYFHINPVFLQRISMVDWTALWKTKRRIRNTS